MTLSVHFLERRDATTPSIERVFRSVAVELERSGVSCTFRKTRFGNGFLSLILNLVAPRRFPPGVIHLTGHINYLGIVLPVDRTIMTVHDATILDYRTGWRSRLIRKLYFEWPLRRLRYITAVSTATRDKLAELTGVPAEKVVVIENPLLVPPGNRADRRTPKPVILQVGTAANKNVERLIEALSGMNCRLWIVGKLSDVQLDLLRRHAVDFQNDPHLNDDEMAEAYLNSDVITFCSTQEGFGLPIIEAQASGIPVVTSDIEPMRSVAGSGAVLVDPCDVHSIREGIASVINDPQLRLEIIERGTANIGRFEPAAIAGQYLELYRRVAAESAFRETSVDDK